jgi:ElaB/YqjD/DUF883 family membrane-anchored ribosome-binding protein
MNIQSNANDNTAIHSDDPEVIEQNIERTRQQMGETIEALQDRLKPERVVSDVKDTLINTTNDVTNQTIGHLSDTIQEIGNAFGKMIERNPIVSALASFGLIASSRKSSPSNQYATEGETMSSPNTTSSPFQQTQETMGDAFNQAHDKSSQLADQVRMGQMNAQTSGQRKQASNWLEQQINRNPLLIGGIALGAGIAIGMLLPTSEPENRMLGPQRDKFLDRVQSDVQDTTQQVKDIASDTMQRVQSVVQEGKDAAINEAQNQGIIGSQQGNG